MTLISIPDMTCGHCKASVEQAIHRLDAGAQIDIDLSSRTARVESHLTDAQILHALGEIGFPATIGG